MNILLIEDNLGDIRLTQEAFKESEFSTELHVVMDGEEALKYLRKRPPYETVSTPDLILLDLNLPKVNGYEVLASVKTDDDLKVIPVIMLSTSKATEDIIKAYKLHANCYITKPSDYDDFSKVMQQVEHFWIKTAILPSMV